MTNHRINIEPGFAIKDFTSNGYLARLRKLIELGYHFGQNFEIEPQIATVVIRHDIDLDLSLALRMAELEERLGIKSTFFVLLNSEFYNCLSKSGRHLLSQIIERGHEIGLHFDSGNYSDNLEVHLQNEAELLSNLTGQPCRYFSQHKPGTYGFKNLASSLVDANFLVQSKKLSYVSDSTGQWRFGDYKRLLHKRKSFQLLVHPIWWMNDQMLHPRKSIDLFMERKIESLRYHLSSCITPYSLEDGAENGWPASVSRDAIE